MAHFIGIDVGGTKIAAGVFTSDGRLLHQSVVPTPREYDPFISSMANLVTELEKKVGQECSVGIGIPGAVDYENLAIICTNLTIINGKPAYQDLEKSIGKKLRFANDADCSALAEAIDGAGTGKNIVLGLIMGTGIGGGVIIDGHPISGPNGLTGEIGHIPLPYYTEEDGAGHQCACGQTKCISSFLEGSALERLHLSINGTELTPPEIAENAKNGDASALKTLDRYYDVVARALIVPIYAYDPDIIIVSGGLNSLPNMYDEVPKRWGKYSVVKELKTKFVPAVHGPMAGMRGAAWLWR